jgi:uncharacterized protein YbjT (DUF2867 family)
MSSVLLVGATGLVGGECLRLLQDDRSFNRVVVLARRTIDINNNSRISQHIVDFDNLTSHTDLFDVDAIICALGTTIKIAGSQAAFRRVDYEYPLEVARIGKEHGVKHFVLVSSMGASSRSRFFYTRVKGQLEDALTQMEFESLSIVRPSLILGERKDVRRAEGIGKRLSFLLPPTYKPVEASSVAKALIQLVKRSDPGKRIIESRAINAIAK